MSCRHHVVLGYTPCLFVALVASYYRVEALDNSSTTTGTFEPKTTTKVLNVSETATTEAEESTQAVIVLDSPTGLISIPQNSSAIKLTWDSVSDAEGYRIEWQVHNDTSDIKYGTLNEKNVTDNMSTINNLRAWTVYNFSVVAIREGLTSKPAVTVNRTFPGAPCPPSNIQLRQLNNSEANPIVLIEWTEPNCTNGPLDGYQISRKRKLGNYSNTSDVNRTLIEISNLHPWTEYAFSVLAYNEFHGKRLESQTVNGFLRTNPSEPGPPNNVTLDYNETSMHAKWLPPDPTNGNITGYNINLKEEHCGNDQSSNEVEMIYETKYSKTNLHAATNYSFSVSAFIEWNGIILIGGKECQDFTTGDDYPSSPSNVNCTAINSTALTISWEEPEPMRGKILNYTVYYGPKESLSRNISTRFKTLDLQQLQPFTRYLISVSAWTSKGEGNLSKPQYCTTMVAAPCHPRNLTLRQLNNYSAEPIVLVKWTEPNCKKGPLDGYKISWKNESSDYINSYSVNETFKVSNLKPWTEYEFSVLAYNELSGEKLESEAINDSLRTTPSEPGPPINLTLVPSERTMHANWLPPNPTNGFIAGYNVSVEAESCEQNQSNKEWETTNETKYFTENLDAATNHSFSIYAFIKHEEKILAGPIECQHFRTEDGHPSNPSNLMCIGESSAAINISWDEPKQMNGEILKYTVKFWEIDPLGNHSTTSTLDRTLTLDQLEPYTRYTITVSAWTSKGQGNWSAPVTCKTKSAVPNTPSEVYIKESKSTIISVAWIPSEPYPGPTTYIVIAKKLRDNCKEISESPISFRTAEDYFEITNLQPSTEYSITIVAETEAGPSRATSAELVWTRPSESGAVGNLELNCNIGSSMASLSWFPPDRPNGELQYYLIEYTGTKANKEDDRKQRKIDVKNPCKYNKVIVTIDGLLPEYRYKFKVSAKVADVESHGTSVTKDCYLPAGFPPPPQKNISVLARLKEEIIFVLQKDTFLDTKGDIIEYAVVVAEAKNIGSNESGGRDSEKLPNWSEFQRNDSVLRYQATPEDWNPFKDSTKDDPLKCEGGNKNVTCTLGCQVECDVNSYCNGPLKPGMLYGFKIRGYTKTGFAETLPVVINTKSDPKSADTNVITAVIVTIVIVSALGIGVFVYYRYGAARFVKSTVMPRASSPPSEIVSFTPNVTHTRLVKLSEFSKHVGVMMSDSALKFSQEFEELKSISPSHPCTAAQLPDNRPKNRWINILPFDHSRVKLLPVDDEPASDYINGSYIPGFTCHREYIATQGPLPGTVDDMWRMIWEQGVNMIVMLTQCVERGKTKCEQYWPAEKQSATYGDLQVQTMCESVLSEYTIRTFDLSLGSRHRVITHLHFTKWPDFGCPENTELLINFVRAVRDHMSEDDPNPLLVHCSAGVGRTGTFIAVDRLMQHILIHDYADIFQSVLDMREHRTNMVQTEDQYIYIHECVRDLVQDKLARDRDSLKDDEIYGNIGSNSTTKV